MPSAIQLSNFFADNVEDAKQSFSIDVANPSLITDNAGTSIQFIVNSFEDASGNTVTGNVDVELIEIYGKSDMVFEIIPQRLSK